MINPRLYLIYGHGLRPEARYVIDVQRIIGRGFCRSLVAVIYMIGLSFDHGRFQMRIEISRGFAPGHIKRYWPDDKVGDRDICNSSVPPAGMETWLFV